MGDGDFFAQNGKAEHRERIKRSENVGRDDLLWTRVGLFLTAAVRIRKEFLLEYHFNALETRKSLEECYKLCRFCAKSLVWTFN